MPTIDKVRLGEFLGGSEEEKKKVKMIAEEIIKDVRGDRKDRGVDVTLHRDMYEGYHSDYFKQRKQEDNETFQRRKTGAVVANYVKFAVDKYADFLYGRAHKVRRKFSLKDSKQTDETMRKMLRESAYHQFIKKARKYTSIYGDAVVRNILVDAKTKTIPSPTTTKTTFPFPVLMEPEEAYPLLNEFGGVAAVVIQQTVKNYSLSQDEKVTELILSDSRWRWVDDGPVVGEQNRYDLNEEFVVFKNDESRFSDIAEVIDLNITVDEALTDNSFFFAYHGWPQLVSEVDLSGVVKSPDHVWQVSGDDDTKKLNDKMMFLQWDGKMEDARNHIKDMEQRILKMAHVAAIATGDLDAIGQLRSGPAIVAAHSPSIMKAQSDQVTWFYNEKGLLEAMAKFYARAQGRSFETTFPEFHVEIDWPADYVPGEELVRAEAQASQINSHTRSLRSVVSENNHDWTEEQIDEEVERIISDSENLTDSKREFVASQKESSGQSASPTKKASEQQVSSKKAA